MRRSGVWTGKDGLIREVTDCLGHSAEGGRRLYPTHGAGERDADELRLVSVLGEDDRQAQAIEGVQEQAVESILDVSLRDADRSEARVSMSDCKEETV